MNRILITSLLLILVGCQSSSKTKSPPTPPSPKSGGMPSAGGMPSKPSGPSKPSSQQGEKDSQSDKGDGSEATEENTAIPPEWEDDEKPTGEGSAENGSTDSDEISFEEPMGSSENNSSEDVTFEDSEALSEEEIAELEKELEESLGDFDETIKREQTYAEQQAKENAKSDEEVSGVGTFESYKGDEDGVDGQVTEKGEGENTAESSSAGGSGGVGDKTASEDDKDKSKKIPDDIPDGRDDDIVARQIREAAMKETDPVLREKLWEEYRNYKNQ